MTTLRHKSIQKIAGSCSRWELQNFINASLLRHFSNIL